MILATSYEGSDDEEELEEVSKNKNTSDLNIVSDSDSDSDNDHLENNEDIPFDKDVNEQVITSPETTVNSKLIRAMKKLQASYNDDANKIIEEGTKINQPKI